MTDAISEAQWLALQKALSTDRLDSYGQSSDPSHDSAVARYLWNAALCESLYPMLHCVEVSLRNRLDTALCRRFGAGWLDNTTVLQFGELARIDEARQKLAKRGNHSPAHANIVAELNLGFWVGLFTRPYERHDRLWPVLAVPVMSGAPRSERTRGVWWSRLDEIRNLRNRAFHYESLWHWVDLDDQHDRLCELLTWLSPEVAALVATVSRFPAVKSRGFDAYEGLLQGAFICPVHNAACRHMSGSQCPSATTSSVATPRNRVD